MRLIPMLLRPFLASLGMLFLAGCFSVETPAYRKVDRDTPAFKEAVTSETAHQQEQGKSPAKAEEIATGKVTRQFVKAEEARRIEQVAPLMQALAAFDRPRGCWAYTATTTTRQPDKTTVNVVRFDPFQPEERLWTLVIHNGQAPDEKTQANYRHAQLRAWKKQLQKRPPKYSETERLKLQAVWHDMEVVPSDATSQTTFTFIRGHIHFAMIVDVARQRETYAIENATNTILSHTKTQLEPEVMLGGSIKMEAFDSSTDYILIEPGLPPFVSKTKSHYRGQFFGKDTGDVEIETVYSDYRRVKCYDDRFEVKIGEPSVMDFMPGND
jgi:hypothetical protein